MTKTPTIIILLILISSSFCAYNWTETEHTIQEAINNGVFSGCVLGVSTNNATLLKKAFGTVGPRRGFYSAPVTADMHFDLGYLTEPIGLNPLIMDMYENSLILTTNRISFLYGDFDNNGKRYITVQNILQHNSGLQATYTDKLPSTASQLVKAINNLKLQYKTQNKTLFSQLGLIVLGQTLAKVAKKSLPDAMFQIMTIIGMRDTTFLPKIDHLKIVPGGYNGKVAWGTAYNKIAHAINDTAGNGGLFSTVSDVITYLQLLLNKGKMPNAFRVYQEETINKFLSVAKYRYTNTRALGWETIPSGQCPCGKKFSASPDSFGMSDDPSGSFVWTDKKKNVSIVLLANGAFPGGRANNPTPYQAAISDAIMSALGY